MKAIVKHFKIVTGTEIRLPDEVVDVADREAACPIEERVKDGRRTRVYRPHLAKPGRPADPIKRVTCDLDNMTSDRMALIVETQYDGRLNPDDADPRDPANPGMHVEEKNEEGA